jgi:hypothetical protein
MAAAFSEAVQRHSRLVGKETADEPDRFPAPPERQIPPDR